MNVPSEYIDGFKRAKKVNSARAVQYILHTKIGDPVADMMVSDLSNLPKEDSEKWVRRILSGSDLETLKQAPASVSTFHETCIAPPDWLNLEKFAPGNSMFFRNARLILASLTGGVLIEGFTTSIARSFFLTGRLRDQGVRRLKQNNRHMLEIFTPGGLEPYNDGWAHSVRLRLVHARVRALLANSRDWDTDALGTPINAAQLGFALSAFSARLLHHLKRLGGTVTASEREGFMAVWRYSGHLMGVPDDMLYTDEKDALDLFMVGKLCEPPPSMESIVLASSLLNSAPLLVGLTEARARQKLADYITHVSRAMIGNDLADQLMYPKGRTLGTLWQFRMLQRLSSLVDSFKPESSKELQNFMTLMEVSLFDEHGISATLPDHHESENSSKW